ncbi:MAG: DNA mismatch repair protein MutS [Gammaproteobacteria bacterium]|nr:DNA mismatch repair protein MutS [Gammaproteobacteria bacterium]
MRRAAMSSDDPDIFRQQMEDVKPLRNKSADIARPRPAPIPRQSALADREVLDEMARADLDEAELEHSEELLFSRSGVKSTVMKKLRRGAFSIQAELDLHGLRSDEARAAVRAFLADCVAMRATCVRIIHGKGLGSANMIPVLKPRLRRWLALSDHVLAFCPARPIDGGTGAVYVLLRRR